MAPTTRGSTRKQNVHRGMEAKCAKHKADKRDLQQRLSYQTARARHYRRQAIRSNRRNEVANFMLDRHDAFAVYRENNMQNFNIPATVFHQREEAVAFLAGRNELYNGVTGYGCLSSCTCF